MKKTKKITVDSEQAPIRLDVFLAQEMEESRSQLKKIIDAGLVLVNGKLPRKSGDVIKGGDVIELKAKSEKESEVIVDGVNKDEKIMEVKIVSEADDYVVVEKPSGMLSHPTEAHEKNTLVDWLLAKYPKIKKVGDSLDRPGIVHRLDREASGLLVVAKNQKMFLSLKQQFQDRTIDKEYKVLAYENFALEHGIIDFAVDRGNDGRMVARPKIKEVNLKNINKIQPGKDALTEYWVEETIGRFTLLKVKIHTGRMHQIRVHLYAFNHPVVGDRLYINRKLIKKTEPELDRLFLHSAKLCFDDLKKERHCFESVLPEELNNFLKKIEI